MGYQAPRLTEVGSVHDLTLGRTEWGPQTDNAVRQGYAGRPGEEPPLGSR